MLQNQASTRNNSGLIGTFMPDGKATLLFIRDGKRKVIKLQMEAINFKFEGVKE